MNENGEVVGINSSGFNGTSESFITDTEELETLLKRNGVEFSSTATSTASPSPASGGDVVSAPAKSGDPENNTMMIIVVGLVVVVVAMGGFIIFMALRQRPQPANTDSIPRVPTGLPRRVPHRIYRSATQGSAGPPGLPPTRARAS